MSKGRITITITKDYVITPEWYDGCSTDEERVTIDEEVYNNDWSLISELLEAGGAEVTVKGEVIQ